VSLLGFPLTLLVTNDVPRVYFLCVVSSLFVLSQVILISTDDAQNLWMASSVIGFSYGSLWGLCAVLCMEWFGLVHFSQNWGYTAMSPALAGNLFGLAFGRDVDSHVEHRNQAVSRHPASLSLLSKRFDPSAEQCSEGRLCYTECLIMTATACTLALALSVFVAWDKSRKPIRAETLWDDDEYEVESNK